MKSLPRFAAGVVALSACLALAACTNSEEPSQQPFHGDTVTPVTVPPSGASDSAAASGGGAGASGTAQPGTNRTCSAADFHVTGSFGAKPGVTVPTDCAPPDRLLTKTLTKGTGQVVRTGDAVTVNYQLTTWSNGKVVQSTFGTGRPFTVRDLGTTSLIKGWDKGLPGAAKGGRVLLVVPPQLGYGAAGNGAIKPNETLIFVIDIVNVARNS